jgi:hypothetical protein
LSGCTLHERVATFNPTCVSRLNSYTRASCSQPLVHLIVCGSWDHYSIHERHRREVFPFRFMCGSCCLPRFCFVLLFQFSAIHISQRFPRLLRLFPCKKLLLGTDCYRHPRHNFLIFLCNSVCLCRFLTALKTIMNSYFV